MTALTAVVTDTDPENGKTRLVCGFCEYRHGDSNPGFRRERAAS